METRIKELETEEIIFGWNNTKQGEMMAIKKNTDLIDFRRWHDPAIWKYSCNILDFNKLSNVKNIILFNNQFKYNHPMYVSNSQNGAREPWGVLELVILILISKVVKCIYAVS